MEKVNVKKKNNPVTAFFKAYFSHVGPRQIATVVLLLSSIVVLVGVCIPHEVTILVGLYIYAAAAIVGGTGAVFAMTHAAPKSPAFRRALINLIIMIVIFAVALTGIIYSHVAGIYNV